MAERYGFRDDKGGTPKDARGWRLARARDKQHLRLALSSLARHGYYVFDEVITEHAGSIDFLAVGSVAVVVILMRSEAGYVSRGSYPHKLLLDGKPFDDDPLVQAAELGDEVSANLFEEAGREIASLVCFTRADFELDEERRPPMGTSPIWELPWALDPEGQEENLTPADIEEIAEKVQKVYGRPPIVTPSRDQEWEGGA